MVRAAYRAAGLAADVEPFLYDMGRQLGQADVMVCRAGRDDAGGDHGGGKAAILIPLPTATDDHQRKNAEALVGSGRRGAAAAARPDRRACWRSGFWRWPATRRDAARMAAAARALARPDAARVIVDRALELVER